MSWTLIESQTLGSSQVSVTLGSGGTIPQTYKSLKVVVSARSNNNSAPDDMVLVYFNGAASNLSGKRIYGLGSGTPGSDSLSNANAGSSGTRIVGGASTGNTGTASTFGNVEITIPNYASTTVNKVTSGEGVGENNATLAVQIMAAGLWSSTNAITSITLTGYYNDFLSGSTFYLYGLK